jgi:hypothetical protein
MYLPLTAPPKIRFLGQPSPCLLCQKISLLPVAALVTGFCAAQVIPPQLDRVLGSNGAQDSATITWPTDPGVRYELQESTDLVNWITVPGFPAQAIQLAQQQAVNLDGGRHFWRVIPIDDQPPVITEQ